MLLGVAAIHVGCEAMLLPRGGGGVEGCPSGAISGGKDVWVSIIMNLACNRDAYM
jgi:hypothetical protein